MDFSALSLANARDTWPEGAMVMRGITFIAVLWGQIAFAEEVTVAVAPGFLATAEKLVTAFETDMGTEIVLTDGTSAAVAQALAGDPIIDVVLTTDGEATVRLVSEGRALEARTYAVSSLVLLSRAPIAVETAADAFDGKVAVLADPIATPHGRAATRAMERLGLDTSRFRPLMVANVAQAGAVFAAGEADLAFVTEPQSRQISVPHVLSLEGLTPAIPVDALLVRESEAARAFWNWMFSQEAAAVITGDGYTVP